MCEKCVEIDKEIERYRTMLLAIDDELTADRAKELITDLQAHKAALHPEQDVQTIVHEARGSRWNPSYP
jgi:hypothetical protein